MSLPPPPINEVESSFTFKEWLNKVYAYVGGATGTIPWDQVDKADSNLADLATKNHSSLTAIAGNTAGYHLSSADYTAVTNKAFATLKVGDIAGGDYTEFEADGTMKATGDATAYRDEFGPLIGARLESPSSDIITDAAEGALVFKSTATLSDYVVMPVQINHDVVAGSTVYPHIHWWQISSNVPNWLIQYRWQVNGAAKTTSWTNVKYTTGAFTYTSGTLNQITAFGGLTPPGGTGVSAILQLRLLRDTTNASTLFAGADPQTGSVSAMSYDVHVQVDTLGSRSEYSK